VPIALKNNGRLGRPLFFSRNGVQKLCFCIFFSKVQPPHPLIHNPPDTWQQILALNIRNRFEMLKQIPKPGDFRHLTFPRWSSFFWHHTLQ